MHPLDGSRLKISRAKSEIDGLRRREEVFRQQSYYRVVRAEINPETGYDVYRVAVSSPPPSPDWSLDVGEIAHNLRCALNYLVYQLAIVDANAKALAGDKSLQFPIVRFQGEWNKAKWRIKLLNPEHQSLVERLQPYPGRGSSEPLFWLEEINNADKHRLIQIVAAKVGVSPFIAYWQASDGAEPYTYLPGLVILENGTKLLEAARDVHVESGILPQVAFCQGCDGVKGRGVVFVLNKIATHVCDIVNSFSSEFQDSSPIP